MPYAWVPHLEIIENLTKFNHIHGCHMTNTSTSLEEYSTNLCRIKGLEQLY